MDVLLTRERIDSRLRDLAATINNDYAGREVVVVGIMSGVVVFLSDLIRGLEIPVRLEFLNASSYRGASTSAGELAVDISGLPVLTGQHVLLLDDIFDTGHTLNRMIGIISAMQPASLQSAVLLWKTERNETGLSPDYFGFEIPNKFVVGYGLDYDGLYRNLPDVRVIPE
ncbi:MAG: hypoxanthine phosphoribosyltransferase [Planctomycetaceae bacterium]|nr:hypoxanthine phosphoribosyltransferase [Planctomycetaceae bacterium]